MSLHPPEGEHDTLTTHCIISIEEGEKHLLQKKGDINYAQDYFKILASNVVEKLIFIIPFAGYIPILLRRIMKSIPIFLQLLRLWIISLFLPSFFYFSGTGNRQFEGIRKNQAYPVVCSVEAASALRVIYRRAALAG
jgi:hypothetical protein